MKLTNNHLFYIWYIDNFMCLGMLIIEYFGDEQWKSTDMFDDHAWKNV